MKTYLLCVTLCAGICLALAGNTAAQSVNSDFWAATDALGRKVREYGETGERKKDKFVAMFYWTWHIYDMPPGSQVNNTTEILREHPEAIRSFDDPAWNNPGRYYWEQPLFGYYKTTDPWVLRKHAEMLADAGIDVVFFDCTNLTLTWKESYDVLMEVWSEALKDGVKAPKIAFMLPFGSPEYGGPQLHMLYEDIYKPGRHRELWFVWKGKPCIMARPEDLGDTPEDREIADFFTFRPGQPDYVNGPQRKNNWGWLELYPQNGYAPLPEGGYEEVPVGVAQNACFASGGRFCSFNEPETFGRNFSMLKGFDPRVDGYLYGWNFQEQWNRALELDPELVFVTGWNEYIAGKWDTGWQGDPFSFVDQFDWEHSRDIEPNNEWWDADGNYRGDTYYYQLIQNVRKFKGMTQREYASETKTIKLDSMAAWTDVKPDFRHYKGNAIKRAHAGHADKYYNSSLGRNDIVDAKIARDAEYIYFYVETASAMTSPQDENWMMLFIDIDRNKSTGWEGYDYVVNYETPDASTGTVSKNVGGKCEWDKAGDFDYVVKGNKMAIRMKRSVLGIKDKIDLEFKWVDNMPKNTESGKPEYNASQFYTCGDAAPGARFNFIYTVK